MTMSTLNDYETGAGHAPAPGPRAVDSVDWLALARRLAATQANMIHHENNRLHGDEFYAEALRRVFRAGQHPRAAELPYETVDSSTGLITLGEHKHTVEGHTVISRLDAERAREQAKAAREEAQRVMVDARRDLAKFIREATNDRTVPAKFRREGVLMAADWIDPDNAATPYGGC